MVLSCRFYSKQYPEVDEVVMVKVCRIAEMGAYVALLEYNNIEGMILTSELSRRRIRSVIKLIKVGKIEPVVVVRVEKEKGYIDLSKRRVSPEDAERAVATFSNAKAVNSILRHVADLMKFETEDQLEDLYQKTAWAYEDKTKIPGSSCDFFKSCVANPELLDECGLDDEIKSVLLENIRQKLAALSVKVRSDIEVTCYAYEGIDAIKDALRQGIQCSTEEITIKINLIAPPVYVVTTMTPDKEKGIELMNKAMAAVEARIKKLGGNFALRMAPKVVSDGDKDLAEQLELAALENAEVSGDDDKDSAEGDNSDDQSDDNERGGGDDKEENGDLSNSS